MTMADMRVKQPKGVRLDHISKIYKDPKTGKDFYAVHDVALDIKPGTFVTLLGPSGCGKTTTLRMIAGFESPDEGEIYLGGDSKPAIMRSVVVLPQPEGPSRVTNVPGAMSSATSCTA